MGKIEQIKERIAEVKKLIQTEGQAALKEAFATFFEQQLNVVALRWRQYTPYFNDGDPCVFSVNECFAKLTTSEEESGDYEDGFEDTYYKDENPTLAAVGVFFGSIQDDQVFETVFGDHVRVTADRDGFTIEEYEHD